METCDKLNLAVIADIPYEASNKGKSQNKLSYLGAHQQEKNRQLPEMPI